MKCCINFKNSIVARSNRTIFYGNLLVTACNIWITVGWIKENIWITVGWIKENIWITVGWIKENIWITRGWIKENIWITRG